MNKYDVKDTYELTFSRQDGTPIIIFEDFPSNQLSISQKEINVKLEDYNEQIVNEIKENIINESILKCAISPIEIEEALKRAEQISKDNMEFGLTNVEVLKLINDTFGTNYASINTYDLLEAIRKEWDELS